jgi:transcription-repair coupling factor (superfamily II helicase)
MLSRFRSDREQRDVVRELDAGAVDIVIGTHRLLQRDVAFHNLGLVVIDEEQRFGVAHKERLKQMRQQVDVLTLSATPIPRTLHMALGGIRDMSVMDTPPEDRLPIKTYVLEFDDHIAREAILRELERKGQVYFVHNRVYNIEAIAEKVRRLVPEAEIAVAHGQMPEDQLERVMLDFARGAIDVLVCTTIIESGLDIPNVNTIVINQADRLGLAQLYQLRGRVGRGASRAYAYLFYDRHRSLTEPAQKRLQAIFEATELGAGFQIALRDLEIRGAGNLLGSEQSGHIGSVGFDLYTRLLADAVEEVKALQRGEKPPVPSTALPPLAIDLPLVAHIPESYAPDLNLRLALYQRMTRVQQPQEADDMAQELRDRFGPLPEPVQTLLYVVRLRALAREAGVQSIQTEDGQIVLRMMQGHRLAQERLRRQLVDASWIGPTSVRLSQARLGGAWREALLQVMAVLAAPGAD